MTADPTWTAPADHGLLRSPSDRELQHVDPLSAMGIGGALYGGFGLVMTTLIVVGLVVSGRHTTDRIWMTLLCWPFLHVVAGALLVWVVALFYNLAARTVGGIRFTTIEPGAAGSDP